MNKYMYIYLNVGLPLGRTPSTSMSSTALVIWLSSLRLTCPYQRSRFCIRCVVIGWTVAALLITSFLMWSLRLTPCIHSNILISVSLISISSFFFIVQHSVPYVIRRRRRMFIRPDVFWSGDLQLLRSTRGR